MSLFIRIIRKYHTFQFLPAIILVLCSLLEPLKAQKNFLDDWGGAIRIEKQQLKLFTHFEIENDFLKGTLDIPQQKYIGAPLVNFRINGDSTHFELESPLGQAIFDGKLTDDTISGRFKQRDFVSTFFLARGKKYERWKGPKIPTNPRYNIEEIEFRNDSIRLAGTLTLPKYDRKHPAIIMITGSGAQDRNEDIHGFPIFHHIAHNFTMNGIAVLRYDDRGVGGSTGNINESTSADFASDVEAAMEFLKARDDINPKEIGLFGHSEGGIVAAMVAAENEEVAFIVSMAGTGLPGGEIIKEQSRLILQQAGAKEEMIKETMDFQDLMIKTITTNKKWEKLERALTEKTTNDLADSDLYNSLPDDEKVTLKQQTIDAAIKQYRSPWFRYFVLNDPSTSWRKVTCPVLALFGGLDIQVPAEANSKAITEALQQAGNTDVTSYTFEKANHLFQYANTGSPTEYPDLDFDFVPGFKNYITQWVFARVFK